VARAAILLATGTGLAITAVIALIRMRGAPTVLLDAWGMFRSTLWVLLPLALFACLAAARLLRDSARAHRVLVELMTVGAFGFVVCGFVALRELNIELDTGTTRWERLESARFVKHERRCGRRQRRICHDHYMYAQWPAAAAAAGGRIEITEAQYSVLHAADAVDVAIRDGWLGHPWIEEVRQARDPEPES
jgi:hypothetical protein